MTNALNSAIKIHTRIGGRFRLQISLAPDAQITRDTGWFDNHITDNGLNICHTDALYGGNYAGGTVPTWVQAICVGAGSSEPADSDTQLESLVATASLFNEYPVASINSSERYLSLIWTKQFGLGEAAGNLTEIGIGGTETSLLARSLIKDGNGDPTALVVTSDEYLTVSYELRIFQPTEDFTGTIDGYSVTGRISHADNIDYWCYGGFGVTTAPQNFPQEAVLTDGAIGDIEDAPSGNEMKGFGVNRSTYVSGSFKHTGTYTLGTSAGNLAGGLIKAIDVPLGVGWWQFEFSPGIPKDNTREVEIEVTLSWGRAS
ncbi:hypothetical protein ACJJIK_10640 [Microbulbifer sp. ZKSA006]|uniref:hypothetical protein n=1 Tax=Microbulbifer sp. ZKSA006 TaxID=3243390 RepID=UPI00403906C9